MSELFCVDDRNLVVVGAAKSPSPGAGEHFIISLQEMSQVSRQSQSTKLNTAYALLSLQSSHSLILSSQGLSKSIKTLRIVVGIFEILS